MIDELVAFLRARYDEREAAARAATPGPWRYHPGKEWFLDVDKMRAARAGVPQSGGEEFVGAGPAKETIGVAATGPSDHPQSMADAAFIALHDPAYVLADIEAKRRIVREATYWSIDARPVSPNARQFAGDTLRLLALPFAGHPDYREDWRP